MLQNLTKPPEGETAGESIQIALAASAPNDGTTASPIHTPAGSRQGSDEPVAAGAAAMPTPAAVEPEAPRLMFKGPRWKRTAVAVHCLLFLSGCVIAAAMMWSVEKPQPRHDVRGRGRPVPALRRVVVVRSCVAGAAPEGLGRALAKKIVEGHRSCRRGRPGHAAEILVRRLAGPAPRAAGEWWIARRLPHIFDVGVTVS